MKVTYDKQVDAMYIAMETIKPRGVKQTIALNDDIIIDFDDDKKILGIEILNASKNIKQKELNLAEKAVA